MLKFWFKNYSHSSTTILESVLLGPHSSLFFLTLFATKFIYHVHMRSSSISFYRWFINQSRRIFWASYNPVPWILVWYTWNLYQVFCLVWLCFPAETCHRSLTEKHFDSNHINFIGRRSHSSNISSRIYRFIFQAPSQPFLFFRFPLKVFHMRLELSRYLSFCSNRNLEAKIDASQCHLKEQAEFWL